MDPLKVQEKPIDLQFNYLELAIKLTFCFRSTTLEILKDNVLFHRFVTKCIQFRHFYCLGAILNKKVCTQLNNFFGQIDYLSLIFTSHIFKYVENLTTSWLIIYFIGVSLLYTVFTVYYRLITLYFDRFDVCYCTFAIKIHCHDQNAQYPHCF